LHFGPILDTWESLFPQSQEYTILTWKILSLGIGKLPKVLQN
jgi:hypothetical protein